MDEVCLSICIPTRNRVEYLRELLPGLIREVEEANRLLMRVELVLSDNASTDDTEPYLMSLACRGLRVFRNPQNIGGDRNFLACVSRARGAYVWLFGDDELLVLGGVERILAVLSKERPALLVLNGCVPGGEPGACRCYSDYGACVREELKTCENFALSHTLITANVFRKDVFDLARAHAYLPTNYAHMYGFVLGLRHGGGVVVLSDGFSVRSRRAQFESWPSALCVKQALYLWRIATWFRVPVLRSRAVRLAANLPLEVLSRCLHAFFPRFGRT